MKTAEAIKLYLQQCFPIWGARQTVGHFGTLRGQFSRVKL